MDWRTCLLLFLSTFLDASTGTQIDCFLDEQECQIEADNLIDFFTEIPTTEECAQLCNDDSTCTAFTHFGSTSHPLHEACFLFSSCRERRPCTDCITGSNQAECTCSVEYSGDLDGTNLVDFIGSVPDEFACKKLCASNDMCSIYTYYGPGDEVNPNVCVLLNRVGLKNPVTSCGKGNNCTTGPAHCYSDQECQVAVFGYVAENNYNIMTDWVFANKSIDLSFEAKEKGCYVNATLLAIGAGGSAYHDRSGAGSGYIEIGRQLFFPNSSIQVSVGTRSGSSLVQVDGETVIEAAGGKGGNRGGGDGYSGGGGESPNNNIGGAGGTNGGDGVNGTEYSGGHGSKLDLSTILMKNFVLTPGKGGVPLGYWAGGGGGVVVNGIKPGNDPNQGEGFGGGAYGAGGTRDGYPGCVLIET